MLVYLHGNCQARAMAQMLAPAFPHWDIRHYEVFADPIVAEPERYRQTVAEAELIVAQPVHDGYRDREDLSLSWVRSHARPDAAIITFPSMFFAGQLIGGTSLAFPEHGMDYPDALLLRLTAAGLDAPEIAAILLSDTLYDDRFIETEVDLAIAELVRRERADAVDVPFSPFLERHALDTQLFHAINHPGRPAMAFMANAVLRHMGLPPRVPDLGEDFLPFPHIPCLPSVRRYFGQRGRQDAAWRTDEPDRYHLPDGRMDAADYLARAVETLRTLPAGGLAESLDDPRIAGFVARAEAAIPALKALPPQRAASAGLVQRAASAGLAPRAQPAGPSPSMLPPAELALRFESLGGTGHGCEFGLFQRELGAEPLGLLRWADLPVAQLTQGLRDGFAGVGAPEFTEIFSPEDDVWGEWWVRDTRYWMAMRSFVRIADADHAAMQGTIAKRQAFLGRKLLEDLREGAKIFVYKNMYETISEPELAALHAAVRAYGPAVLLYLAVTDAAHPDGTVECRAPGLLVGYVAHFGFSPRNEQLGSAAPSFLRVCERACAMWDAGQAHERPSKPEPDALAAMTVEQALAAAEASRDESPERALEIWAALRSREPSHSAAYLRAAEVLGALGRRDEGAALIAHGAAMCPHDASLGIGHAIEAHARGDFAIACERWAAAHARFPGHPGIAPHYLSTLEITGREDDARALRASLSPEPAPNGSAPASPPPDSPPPDRPAPAGPTPGGPAPESAAPDAAPGALTPPGVARGWFGLRRLGRR